VEELIKLREIKKYFPWKRHHLVKNEGELITKVEEFLNLGCRFHTRCSEKIGEICEKVFPSLKEIEDKHSVSCHLYD